MKTGWRMPRNLVSALVLGSAGVALSVMGSRPGPDPVRDFLSLAQEAAGRGQITVAALNYNRGIATDPRDPRPYIGLAILYEAQNRSDQAVAALEQLARAQPDAQHLRCRLAEALLGAEDARGALEVARVAVAREPACARAFSTLGLALARGRYWVSASDALRKAQELAPDDPTIGEARLQVFLEQGELQRAAELADSLSARIDSARFHFNAGSAYAQMVGRPGSVELAEGHLNRAAELAPTWFEPRAELGQLYQRMGREKDAAREFERAWRISPAPGVAYNLAQVWRRLGDPRAAGLAAQFPKLARDAARLGVLRARTFQQQGNAANVIATARAEAAEGRFAAGLLRLRKLLARDPADLDALRAYAELDRAARRGRPDYLTPGPAATAL
jgi:Flp pilus assembly protein TadD